MESLRDRKPASTALRRVVGGAVIVAGLGVAAQPAEAAPSLSTSDVKTLQRDANEDLVPYGLPELVVDGKLGNLSKRAICTERWLTGHRDTRSVSRTTPEDVRLLDSLDTLRVPKPLVLVGREIDTGKAHVTYAVANLACQTMVVVENDELVRIMPISSGKPGHETPTGLSFTKQARRGWHDSSLYPSESGNGNMYFPVYLGEGPIAVHGSREMDAGDTTPQSHGCLRVLEDDAEFFYDFVGGQPSAPEGQPETTLQPTDRRIPVITIGTFDPRA